MVCTIAGNIEPSSHPAREAVCALVKPLAAGGRVISSLLPVGIKPLLEESEF